MKSLLVGVWSPFHGQTCNTGNAVAIATRMAVSRNFKILLMHNTVNKSNMENGFFQNEVETNQDISAIFDESGVDALMKLARTSCLNAENFKDYTDIIIPDRLEVLRGTLRKDGMIKELLLSQIQYIIACAKTAYDFVFLDINAGYGELSLKTLQLADILIISLNQNMEVLSTYFKKREWDLVLDRKPHLIVLGNYDEESDYKVEKIQNAFKFDGELCPIPRNVKFMDSFNTHSVLDYFSRDPIEPTRTKREEFLSSLDRVVKKLIYMSNLEDINTYTVLNRETFFDKILKVFK